jgi:hypothetical protein
MRRSALFVALAIAGGALGTNAAGAGTEAELAAFATTLVPRGPAGLAIGPARALAAERLGSSACREIFEVLPDFTGRPVARRLEAGERSPSSHFSRLSFIVTTAGPCARNGVAAWSVAGEPCVRVCPHAFIETARRDRGEAAAILIHEALHTLGVGEEAAPEPLTDFVRHRCGL